MIGLDTNVLVRYLTGDDREQYESAVELITSTIDAGEEIYINCTVLCEMVWVLRSAYQTDRSTIAKIIREMLDTRGFVFDDSLLVRQACEAYSCKQGDYADYLIGLGNQEAGCRLTATFDHALTDSKVFLLVK
jgi:predicted nucleic-acid-binding protein